MKRQDVHTQATQVFLDAANYIRKYGWQEKGMGQFGKRRCSMGAIASVYPKKANPALPALMYETLYKELNGLNLTQYNHKFKNGDAVINLFERTALTLQDAPRSK